MESDVKIEEHGRCPFALNFDMTEGGGYCYVPRPHGFWSTIKWFFTLNLCISGIGNRGCGTLPCKRYNEWKKSRSIFHSHFCKVDINEDAARAMLVTFAVKNCLYFVMNTPLLRSTNEEVYCEFIALKNSRCKKPEIYIMTNDIEYNNFIKNDEVQWKANISSKFSWQDALQIVKANSPIRRSWKNNRGIDDESK